MDKLETLISALPECYQPIYGHLDLDLKTSRTCNDRLSCIKEIYEKLEHFYKRPLRVLDLGCAQGFFSLSLAEIGAKITGIDFLDKNIDVCTFLKKENPNFNVEFHQQSIEIFLNTIDKNQYDMVLGLSVFHHLIHIHGLNFVQNILKNLSEKVDVCFFELALKNEPLYWAESLPENERDTLKEIAFFNKVGDFKTHLSDVIRPLYFASNQFWYINGCLEKFDSWTFVSNDLVPYTHENSRRYFFNKKHVLKFFELDHPTRGEHNKKEINNEIYFFENYSFGDYSLISYKIENNVSYIVIGFIEGYSLLNLIQKNDVVDDIFIIREILKKLVKLEDHELYYDDLRLWNIYINISGIPILLDYGSISKKKKDCFWPKNPYLSFFSFVYDLSTKNCTPSVPFRNTRMTPYSLPIKYRNLLLSLWDVPMVNWNFQLILEKFNEHINQDEKLMMPADFWMREIEDAVSHLSNNVRFLTNDIKTSKDYEKTTTLIIKEKEDLELSYKTILKEKEKLELSYKTILKEKEELELSYKTILKEKDIFYNSRSWKYTKFFRKIVHFFKSLL